MKRWREVVRSGQERLYAGRGERRAGSSRVTSGLEAQGSGAYYYQVALICPVSTRLQAQILLRPPAPPPTFPLPWRAAHIIRQSPTRTTSGLASPRHPRRGPEDRYIAA